MCLMTTHEKVTAKPLWVQGEWTDGAEDFWEDFVLDGKLENENKKIPKGCTWAQASDYGFSILRMPSGHYAWKLT